MVQNQGTREGSAGNGPGILVNTGGMKDPLQGYDASVHVVNQVTGEQVLVGDFSSCQFTFQRTTQKYIELNQTVERNLDGIIKFDWVLERGLLSTDVFAEVFGFTAISREFRINRSPRFMITFTMDAPELEEAEGDNGANDGNDLGFGSGVNAGFNKKKREARGAVRLITCKLETFIVGAVGGEAVIANRWEGMAEGMMYVPIDNLKEGLPWPGTSGEGIQAPIGRDGIDSIFSQENALNFQSGDDGNPTWWSAGDVFLDDIGQLNNGQAS